MIGRVVSRPKRPFKLLEYLFGPGRKNEHVRPHLVAAWAGCPERLEPPGEGTQGRWTWRLAQTLLAPTGLARGVVPEDLVWHCVVRAAPCDPQFGDGAWQPVVAEMMHRTGLSVHGEEDRGCRWVAVHHGGNHVHVVAVLARMDGRPVSVHRDYYRVQEAMAWAERTYGLTSVARAGPRGTAACRPTWAETEKAAREQDRAARTEEEFLAGLAARGVAVLARPGARPGEVAGYAFGLQSDTTGKKGGPVWFGGSKLAPDLSLPRLRARWASGPGRLSGRAMSKKAARPILAREVLSAAQAARTEDEFFARLDRAGLLVTPPSGPDQPDGPAKYAISMPGLARRGIWFADNALNPQLDLERLRARWVAGLAGCPPGPDRFDGADARWVYAYAASVAQRAAEAIQSGPGRERADIAWAAGDLITAAAEATASPVLRQATDEFRRAARTPWGRVPAVRSPAAVMVRTAAYALAACARVMHRPLVLALIGAIANLAKAISSLRRDQTLREQGRRVREERAYQLRQATVGPQEPRRQPQVRSLQAEDAARAAAAQAAGPNWGTDPAAAAAAAAQSVPRSRPPAVVPASTRHHPSASR